MFLVGNILRNLKLRQVVIELWINNIENNDFHTFLTVTSQPLPPLKSNCEHF